LTLPRPLSGWISKAGATNSKPGATKSKSAATKTNSLFVAYRAALKRLEAGADENLFDDPVLWPELKSAAWDGATRQNSPHIP
jgi:hypothetical protein